jgi:hypothetical protein
MRQGLLDKMWRRLSRDETGLVGQDVEKTVNHECAQQRKGNVIVFREHQNSSFSTEERQCDCVQRASEELIFYRGKAM